MMTKDELVAPIARARGDAAVVTTMGAVRAWARHASSCLELRLELEAPQGVVPLAFQDLSRGPQRFAGRPVEVVPPLDTDLDEIGLSQGPELQ